MSGSGGGPGDAPVVVGALGGSGTRAVAQILAGLGIDMGADLNGASDDLLFTLLFKQPRWLERTGAAGVDAHLDLYERLRTGGPTGAADLIELVKAVPGFDPRLGRRAAAARVRRAWAGRRRPGPARWGWKEPNSHVVLDRLTARWPHMAYVHVVRHGLDMAWSSNRQQLDTWGGRFGVEAPAPGGPGEGGGDAAAAAARAQLDYWIASTRRAVQLGEVLGPRFLLLDYDHLCAAPADGVRALASVAGLEVDGAAVDRLAAVVDPPDTVGRWQAHGTGAFRADQLDAVAGFGFAV